METKKIYQVLKWIIRIAIVGIAGWMFIKQEYRDIGILAITLAVTFYDILLEKLLKIKLDEKLKISIILFIFAAQCLGSVLDFYGKMYWWDTMLHTLSGVLFFYIGISVIEQINERTTKSNISIPIKILFAIGFSFSMAVIWEIFEFTVDTFLGGNMQVTKGMVGQEAVKDTMIDLISVTIGTMLITIVTVFNKKIMNKKSREETCN